MATPLLGQPFEQLDGGVDAAQQALAFGNDQAGVLGSGGMGEIRTERVDEFLPLAGNHPKLGGDFRRDIRGFSQGLQVAFELLAGRRRQRGNPFVQTWPVSYCVSA